MFGVDVDFTSLCGNDIGDFRGEEGLGVILRERIFGREVREDAPLAQLLTKRKSASLLHKDLGARRGVAMRSVRVSTPPAMAVRWLEREAAARLLWNERASDKSRLFGHPVQASGILLSAMRCCRLTSHCT